MKEYSPRYFKEQFPDWKKHMDSWLLTHFYRPISFVTASWAYHMGLTSNMVSFISMFVGLAGCLAFLCDSFIARVVGCVLVTIWMIMDCTDGNLARSVKSYPYGDFIDAISGYVVLALLVPCAGTSAYYTGGILFERGNFYLLMIGVFAGFADALARLFYQKYQNNSYEYQDDDVGDDNGKQEKHITKDSFLYRAYNRLSKEVGLNGLMIPWLYVAVFTHSMDLFVVFYFVFQMAVFVANLFILVRKSGCLRKDNVA